jgi:hypothetical protein
VSAKADTIRKFIYDIPPASLARRAAREARSREPGGGGFGEPGPSGTGPSQSGTGSARHDQRRSSRRDEIETSKRSKGGDRKKR